MNWQTLLSFGWLALLAAIVAAVTSIIFRTLRNGIPPMPSSERVRRQLHALLQRQSLPEQGTVVELGSGWGGVAVAASRAMSTARVIGYENSLVPFLFSCLTRRVLRRANLSFVHKDFRGESLRTADLIICYLAPQAMVDLKAKFAAELKPSALVVSITFALPGCRPSSVTQVTDLYRTPIYLYSGGSCQQRDPHRKVDLSG